MNNIKSLETVLSELSDEKKKRIESVANIQAIADELQFLVQQEVARKGRECTFDDYTMLHIRQVAEWIHKGQQRSLVLYGPYGVGKTIMLYALERYFCRHYADWRDDTREHFTASVTADNLCLLSTDPNNVDKIYCYKNCDILFIDDAGAEKEKYLCYGNPITPVADIIDHRYIRRKKTIFTTNLVPAELCSRYGERIADRMNEDYAFIMYSNHPSYRQIMEKIKKTSLYLPADLMKRLKIYCIQEEKTMTAVLQEAIEAFVCRKEKLAEKRQEGTLF